MESPEDTKRKKAIQLLEILGVKRATEIFVEMLLENKGRTSGIHLKELRKLINIDNLMWAIAETPDSVFTEEELDAMIKFHGSPIGQSIINKTDEGFKEATPFILKYVEERLRQSKSKNEPS